MTLSYPISLPVTVLGLVLAGAVALVLLKPRETVLWPCVALLVFALYAAARYASWSATLDDAGLHVSAPLSIGHRGGDIAWEDVVNLRVGKRRSTLVRTLHVVSLRGGALLIPIGDMGPDDAERLVSEIQRRARLPDERGGKAYEREAARGSMFEVRPALLELRDDGPAASGPGSGGGD